MANTNHLFTEFNKELQVTAIKEDKLIKSRNNLRTKIKDYFAIHHKDYKPRFWIQGSYKMGTTIRTKDDTCDLDDGVYFTSNPKNVSCTTLQSWVKDAVYGTTERVFHKEMCVTVDYKADYNIDIPVYLYDKTKDTHPRIAIKYNEWRDDDPKEMVDAFNKAKDNNGQLIRIVKYLKAWCDHKRDKMPSGLAMTILVMNNWVPDDQDDVSLKYTIIEIEKVLKPISVNFKCIVPATPYDDIFENYDTGRRDRFMDNLADFIKDAKKAVDEEKNIKAASDLWRKHLGSHFPVGEDKTESAPNSYVMSKTIGTSKPYYEPVQ